MEITHSLGVGVSSQLEQALTQNNKIVLKLNVVQIKSKRGGDSCTQGK
jgi:hypothetical protein